MKELVKVKTSIYIEKTLWEMFKRHAVRKGVEVSKLLEELIKDEIVEYSLDDILLELAGSKDYELDFEPIEPKKGTVSELVRAMRNERANSISG
ncbi:MAG: CopG family transcriptional regulator [Thermoprotei archaeon]|nr:CopG family transcriptional regulator [Thermoprotei archaeon]